MNKFLITALEKIITSSPDEMKIIIDAIENDHCAEFDRHHQDEEFEDCIDQFGDTGAFFDKPTKVPNQWLVHFTNETSARKILSEGYTGRNLQFLGKTAGERFEYIDKAENENRRKWLINNLDKWEKKEYKHWKRLQSLTGKYGFAYLLEDIDDLENYYGVATGLSSALIFKSKIAVRAFHIDLEWQVIFHVNSMYDTHVLRWIPDKKNYKDPHEWELTKNNKNIGIVKTKEELLNLL